VRALLAAAAAALLLGALPAGAAPPATLQPGQLTVGVSLPSDGFEVGVVKGTDVIYAEGFDIDLTRALAKRLKLPTTAFVQSRFDRLYSAGVKPWDLAVAQITITGKRLITADFTRPYLSVDQGVLLSQTVTSAPKTIAGLRTLRVCALAKSSGEDVVRERITPARPVRPVGNLSTLMLDLQTGRCQAVVYDAPTLGTLKARAPERYGQFVGVIRTGEQYGIALPKGSPLLKPVDAALGRLIEDGTLGKLQKKWLTADLSKLPVLG